MSMTKEGTLELLWQRMSEKGDFPSLQRSVSSIVSAMQSEDTSTADLASSVLSDFALTQKVIRLANSAMYAPFGCNVTTVSRAIMILGVDTIGHLALSLKLLEGFGEVASHRQDMARELARASLAGAFARDITAKTGIRDGEEAVVCTLLHHVARMLVAYCFPEEWQQIQQLASNEGISDSDACERVLAISFPELAEAAAHKWGLPDGIARSMRPAEPADPDEPLSHADWLCTVANLSNEMVGELTSGADPDRIAALAASYADRLALDATEVVAIGEDMVRDTSHQEFLSISTGAPSTLLPPAGKPLDSVRRLATGLTEVRAATPGADADSLLNLTLEAIMQSLGFANCAAFLRNTHEKAFEARYGIGCDIQPVLGLSFPAAFEPDVFHLALTNGRAIFIENAHEPRIATRIPRWHRQHFGHVKSFFLLPVQQRNQPVALLYGDWGHVPCAGGLGSKEMEFLHHMGDEISKKLEGIAAPAEPSLHRKPAVAR
ncbi:HDOD domain-containing protein [Pandoraea terrae]|nr:HDOD domain-containing protein [Pandoraea terrae]